MKRDVIAFAFKPGEVGLLVEPTASGLGGRAQLCERAHLNIPRLNDVTYVDKEPWNRTDYSKGLPNVSYHFASLFPQF